MELRLQKVRRDMEEAVMREQVLRPLVRLNFPGAAVPRFVLEGEKAIAEHPY